MTRRKLIVIGGGAAGFFGAITAAEAASNLDVTILEKGPQFLSKVRISGGGRCNVTHALFDPREFTQRYPRGEKALIGPFHQFQAKDTVAWFESRGVKLKTEPDGRMFPITDSSRTVIDCLLHEAEKCGVKLLTNRAVERVERTSATFRLTLANSEMADVDYILLATGGCRTPALGALAISLGHTLQPPVPSLFTLQIEVPWVRQLSGLSVADAEVSVAGTKLLERGPLLFTHWGLSGPAILRLSAWGARVLHELAYKFVVRINWLPAQSEQQVRETLRTRQQSQPAKFILNTPVAPLPARLWEALVLAAGISREMRWSNLSRAALQALTHQLCGTELPVTGKSLNKDEFVTCGGVHLNEVNFKTMESKSCPGLYFAGELLDIDGITGGFNFQSAWTTGWLAGKAIAAVASRES